MKLNKMAYRAALAVLLTGLALAPAAARGHGMMGMSNYTKPEGIDLSAQAYKDGTYTGTANAFRPGLTVAVTVKGGKVTAVKVTEHNEDGARYYDYPIKVIPAAIVKAQKTGVDAVSGATATSYGIMSAVENALLTAK